MSELNDSAGRSRMTDFSRSAQEQVLGKQLFKHRKSVSFEYLEYQRETSKMSAANKLFQAVLKGNVSKVLLLLNRGANINAKNDYGYSPLVAALRIENDHKRDQMFTLLLEKGANVKARDEYYDRTVLHWACILRQSNEVRQLLDETAGDMNLQDKDVDGCTALHHAVSVGDLSSVERLVQFHLRFGVTVDAVDNLGLTPYVYARRLGYGDVAAVLNNKGLASVGHGDNLFRSPREWSQIGKFERKKEIELRYRERMNAAKMFGKLAFHKKVGIVPRTAVSGFVVPRQKLPPPFYLSPRKTHHDISESFPWSLGDGTVTDKNVEETYTGEIPGNDAEVNGAKKDINNPDVVDLKSFQQTSPGGYFRFSSNTGNVYNSSNNNISNNSNKSSHVTCDLATIVKKEGHNCPLEARPCSIDQPNCFRHQSYLQTTVSGMGLFLGKKMYYALPAAQSGTNNCVALSLLEKASFSEGHVANNFQHSQFDESKAAEYEHVTRNLNSIMDVLSQQQTKSFRQSVNIAAPERLPTVKTTKNEISTWAILFGDKTKIKGKKRKGDKEVGKKGERTQQGRQHV